MVTRTVESHPGDYRLYYEGIRDALLGRRRFPCRPWLPGAWRELLEWAKEALSSTREIVCDWSEEPSGLN